MYNSSSIVDMNLSSAADTVSANFGFVNAVYNNSHSGNSVIDKVLSVDSSSLIYSNNSAVNSALRSVAANPSDCDYFSSYAKESCCSSASHFSSSLLPSAGNLSLPYMSSRSFCPQSSPLYVSSSPPASSSFYRSSRRFSPYYSSSPSFSSRQHRMSSSYYSSPFPSSVYGHNKLYDFVDSRRGAAIHSRYASSDMLYENRALHDSDDFYPHEYSSTAPYYAAAAPRAAAYFPHQNDSNFLHSNKPMSSALDDTYKNPNKVFIGGLGVDSTHISIKNYMKQFGKVVDTAVLSSKITGKSRGFGFCTFANEESVEKCMDQKHRIDGVPVEVRRALPRNEVPVHTTISKEEQQAKIFVGGLPFHVTEAQVVEFFEKFGKVKGAMLVYDKITHKPRGFAFVTFFSSEDADKAVGEHNFLDYLIETKKATPKEEMEESRNMRLRDLDRSYYSFRDRYRSGNSFYPRMYYDESYYEPFRYRASRFYGEGRRGRGRGGSRYFFSHTLILKHDEEERAKKEEKLESNKIDECVSKDKECEETMSQVENTAEEEKIEAKDGGGDLEFFAAYGSAEDAVHCDSYGNTMQDETDNNAKKTFMENKDDKYLLQDSCYSSCEASSSPAMNDMTQMSDKEK